MPASKIVRNNGLVISALHARSNFGQLLRRVAKDSRSLVIEKRGTPRAILLSIRDYVRLASPEPEVLIALGKESKQRGTGTLRHGRLTASLRRRVPGKRNLERANPGNRSSRIRERMLPLRLVLDTNIVVSAALKPDGLQRTVLLLAITKPARLYVSTSIFSEYRTVLSRPELRIRRGLRLQFLQFLKNRAHLVSPSQSLQITTDPPTTSSSNAPMPPARTIS